MLFNILINAICRYVFCNFFTLKSFFQVISLRDSLIIRSSAKKHIVTVKGVPACIIEYKKREDDKKLLERRASPKQAYLKKDLIV